MIELNNPNIKIKISWYKQLITLRIFFLLNYEKNQIKNLLYTMKTTGISFFL